MVITMPHQFQLSAATGDGDVLISSTTGIDIYLNSTGQVLSSSTICPAAQNGQ
jgi:hypothetical protein